MSSKFSFQTAQDFRHGTTELHAMESSNLMMARHEMEMKLASLREAQRELLQQLKAAQSGVIGASRVSWLRTNIVQVNNHIESVSLELARLNHKLRKRN
jgi:flagellar biosynthesis chaperone FliJ